MHDIIAKPCKTVHSTCVGRNRCIAEVLSAIAMHFASMSWTSISKSIGYWTLCKLDMPETLPGICTDTPDNSNPSWLVI